MNIGGGGGAGGTASASALAIANRRLRFTEDESVFESRKTRFRRAKSRGLLRV